MIESDGDARTERFAEDERVKQFEPFRRQAEKVLDRLEAAANLGDISGIPSFFDG